MAVAMTARCPKKGEAQAGGSAGGVSVQWVCQDICNEAAPNWSSVVRPACLVFAQFCFNSGCVLRPKMHQKSIKNQSQNGQKSIKIGAKSGPKSIPDRPGDTLGRPWGAVARSGGPRVPLWLHFGSLLAPFWLHFGPLFH